MSFSGEIALRERARAAIDGGSNASKERGMLREGTAAACVTLSAPASFEADQYRVLRHRIERARETSGVVVIGVSSPAAGDGKTTTALNLAGSLAQSSRVLLVDVDLRRAAVSDTLGFGAPGGPGLADAVLDPGLSLEDVERRLPRLDLTVVAAGRGAPPPFEILKAPRCGELLTEWRRRYDYVILDTPPLVPVPDCRVLARFVDGFLVVVRAHRTPRALLGEALNALEPAKVLGLVFNGSDRPAAGHYASYYDQHQARPHSRLAAFWSRRGMRR